MSAAIAAIIAENTVLAAGIVATTLLLRQGGGVQVKAPSAPRTTAKKTPAEPAAQPKTLTGVAAEKAA